MHEELSVLWMYEPDNMPARQDMDLSTADYYCGLWKLESLLDHLAREERTIHGKPIPPRRSVISDCETIELFELEPWMIAKSPKK